MMAQWFGGSHVTAMKQTLESSHLTHQEVGQNLANVDTPGYRSHETDFKTLLLEARDDKPERGRPFDAYLEEVSESKPGVNVERELARLSQASLEQAAAVRLLSTYYSQLRLALTEGKR